MWIVDAIEWVKNIWENWLKEFIIYGAIFVTFVLSGLLRSLYRAIKNAILGLFTVEGAVAFILAAAGVLIFLTKLNIIKW
ncbi:MAG TPA: hypothetical protein PLP48_08690 [Acholeplasmataceae bacterium]|nr:hypothetical protein [Acholeplasmataceae bacterium]